MDSSQQNACTTAAVVPTGDSIDLMNGILNFFRYWMNSQAAASPLDTNTLAIEIGSTDTSDSVGDADCDASKMFMDG